MAQEIKSLLKRLIDSDPSQINRFFNRYKLIKHYYYIFSSSSVAERQFRNIHTNFLSIIGAKGIQLEFELESEMGG